MNKNIIILILIIFWLLSTLIMAVSIFGLMITFLFRDNEENFLWFMVFDKLITKIE